MTDNAEYHDLRKKVNGCAFGKEIAAAVGDMVPAGNVSEAITTLKLILQVDELTKKVNLLEGGTQELLQETPEKCTRRADLTEFFFKFHTFIANQYENQKTPDKTMVEELVNRGVVFVEGLTPLEAEHPPSVDVPLRTELVDVLLAFREEIAKQRTDRQLPIIDTMTASVGRYISTITQIFADRGYILDSRDSKEKTP